MTNFNFTIYLIFNIIIDYKNKIIDNNKNIITFSGR